MFKIDVSSRSDIGHRRETNQDRLFAETAVISGVSCGMFCVADGMGGLADGHYAASFTVDSMAHWWSNNLSGLIAGDAHSKDKEIEKELIGLLTGINANILHRAREQNTRYGTTCSLLLVCDNQYFIAHSGDSRIYLVQKQLLKKREIRQLTEDHNWLSDQLKLGFMQTSELLHHPNRKKLTGGIGVFECPRVFTFAGELKKNDTFILCSDGLYQIVSDDELAKTAVSGKKSDVIADNLMHMALSRTATDNVSMIVLTFSENGKNPNPKINISADLTQTTEP
ncbi:MAG: serine/threonine-protein phosphatase [Defluviitaleaceae bacterium]|nr:serine/threonine-protein phosphatase [Defluviitaleaceae bacterium]